MPRVRRIEQDAKYSLAREVLRLGRSVRMRVLGTSMVPSLWPGDLVTIEGRLAADLSLGEIVLVRRDARLYLHRLIGLPMDRDRLSAITQGDALSVPDPPASDTEVLGILTKIERNGAALIPSRTRSLWNRSLATLLGSSVTLLNCALHVRQQYAMCGSDEALLEPVL